MFLSTLADRFLQGDHNRVVIVPGNHDVSFPHVIGSLRQLAVAHGNCFEEEAIAQYVKKLRTPCSTLRWSWAHLSFFELIDPDTYHMRFQPFADFYHSFYGTSRTYSLTPEQQYDIFAYPDLDLAIAAFNSCHNNDPLNRTGSIHPDCIATAFRQLSTVENRRLLRFAVWHHSTSASPYRDDYMDPEILQVFIDYGFSIAFHGHHHRPQVIDERFLFGEDRKITIIIAGTLCGGSLSLSGGQPRSYNVIEIDTAAFTAKLHLRQMLNSTFESPIWGPGLLHSTRKSYIEFGVQQPHPASAPRESIIFAEAEKLLAIGKPEEATKLVLPYAQTNDIARRLLREALVSAGDTRRIIDHLYPPQGSAEFLHVADALWEEKDYPRLRALLADPAIDRSDPAIAESSRKYSARLGL